MAFDITLFLLFLPPPPPPPPSSISWRERERELLKNKMLMELSTLAFFFILFYFVAPVSATVVHVLCVASAAFTVTSIADLHVFLFFLSYSDAGQGNLRAAVAEAAWMTGKRSFGRNLPLYLFIFVSRCWKNENWRHFFAHAQWWLPGDSKTSKKDTSLR